MENIRVRYDKYVYYIVRIQKQVVAKIFILKIKMPHSDVVMKIYSLPQRWIKCGKLISGSEKK